MMKKSDLPISILYLDDEEHNLISFRAAFRKHFQIYTTTSAREAVDLLRTHQIPIVITDQRMPEMMGVQFLEAIIPEFPDTIRMILTGFSDVEAIIKAINTGRVYRYITKPWVESELLMTLQGAAEMVRLQHQNKRLIEELQQRVQDQERVMKLFQKYVPEHVVTEVLGQDEDSSILKGELRIVSVLLCDIRDFTARAAELEPRKVVAFLNDYFSLMTDCVKAHNGTVNKFIGDGILAIFGAPVSYLHNQENAVLCALDMVEKIHQFNERHRMELGGNLKIGIGINTGEVVVGNIGTEERVEYTVIGDTVNMASRIERLTKGHDNAVFISSSTYQRVSDIVQARVCGPFSVPGKEEAIELYEVMGRKQT
ncbi:adenylate/guanylate cyclase domain-containing protein [Alicyclobacillus tolerans]|uniref:Class 3 adenylate cyclase n=1 Tax=Alicyclobacillus tolerans TaxID=90970 RepID=A0ABT9LYT3_9BACL|nr:MULTISPECIES: adenylate/guanylate cyclase domain-containing protein [Alicyclobacillus]MDP9729431.1 class 3 adenylate cyclase [Alicyclobacillus tengchongensis]